MSPHWSEKLKAFGACNKAVEWARTQPSATAAWKACERGDWMLWLLGERCRTTAQHRRLVLAACDCAATALKYIPKDEKRKAYNSLSRLLVQRNRPADAIAVIKRGISEFPSSGGLHYQWGEALLKMGNKREAKERFKQAARDSAWREIALRRMHSIRID